MGPPFSTPRNVVVIGDDSDDDFPQHPIRGFGPPEAATFPGATGLLRTRTTFADTIVAERPKPGPRPGDRVSNHAWTRQLREQGMFIDLSNSEDEDVEELQSPEIKPPPPEALVTDPAVLYQDFEDKVKNVFPEICSKFLRNLYDARVHAFGPPKSLAPEEDMSGGIILHVTDMKDYPKEEKTKAPKRKRQHEENSDEEAKEWTAKDRIGMSPMEFYEACKALQNEFESVPYRYILNQLKNHRTLYEAYRTIEAEDRESRESATPAFQRLKKPRKSMGGELLSFPTVKRELEAVRRRRDKEEALRQRTKMEAEADAARDKKAFDEGDTLDCQCCFTETPSAKMTHCDADEPHFFCLDCAGSNAKAELDLNRYKLKCMDGSNCPAEFPKRERPRFLDEDTIALLDRLQQQTELREANVENLEQCPFCDFAAICPPKSIDKEFRCLAEDCSIVSCRLCREESHIPKTCKEHKREQGVDERHIVEESMTEALLRRCPKCKVPIIKDGGCNKLVCSQCGCKVCDVCGQDISKDGYNHFMRGSCPQMDDHVDRDQKRIEEAERQAREKIRADNPDLSEEDLQIKFSDAVKARPQPRDPYAGFMAHYPHVMARNALQYRIDPNGAPHNLAPPPYQPPPGVFGLPHPYGPPQDPYGPPAVPGRAVDPLDPYGRQLGPQPPNLNRGQGAAGPFDMLLQQAQPRGYQWPGRADRAAGYQWPAQEDMAMLRRERLQRAQAALQERARYQPRVEALQAGLEAHQQLVRDMQQRAQGGL